MFALPCKTKMPGVALRKRHSLRGVNIFPLLKRLKEYRAADLTEFARMGPTKTEDLAVEQIQELFLELTGEIMPAFVEMSGREFNVANSRLALHLAILYANEFGQPKGQDLVLQKIVQDNEENTEPKRAKRDDHGVAPEKLALEKRVQSLEQKEGTEGVQSLKDKVRALATQTLPSEPLILMWLDELARIARKHEHPDAETFSELSRQAVMYQGKLDVASLCLSVLGGRASDVVSKALAKCLKEKQPAAANNVEVQLEGSRQVGQKSPLANLYPQVPLFYPPMPGVSPQGPYGFQPPYMGGPRYSYPRAQGRGGAVPRQRGACLFCESVEHYVKDCEKMKLAKGK